jgi:hypothetical protein
LFFAPVEKHFHISAIVHKHPQARIVDVRTGDVRMTGVSANAENLGA